VVVGNPPYGSIFTDNEERFIKNHFKDIEYRTESYVAFMQQTFQQLKQNGLVGMIVPDNWMYLDFTENLRFTFLKESNLVNITALPSTVFEGATVDTCIYITQKSQEIRQETKVIPHLKNKAIESINDSQSYFRSQDYWLSFHSYIINPYLSPTEGQILEKVERDSSKLSDISEIKYGLKAYQTGKGIPEQTPETLEKRPFTSELKMEESFEPFFEGQHIGRYEFNWDSNNWIR
jgi:type I restriction-modification system DNA methylase subunit